MVSKIQFLAKKKLKMLPMVYFSMNYGKMKWLYRSVDEEDTLSLIVKGDKMTLRGKGIQKPKNEK